MPRCRSLDDVCQQLTALERQYTNDRRLTNQLSDMRYDIKDLQSKTQLSLGKKILITVGLAFLSACTVRYWMDKAEPLFYIPHTHYEEPYERR